MENTKEYICRAVVSVVDHLGTVSANLNGCLSQTNAFSEAELRINCLKQVSFFFFFNNIYIYIYIFFCWSFSIIYNACMPINYIYIYISLEDYKVETRTLRETCLVLWQRLLVCEQYAHKLALTQLRWRENLTRYHRRYLSKRNYHLYIYNFFFFFEKLCLSPLMFHHFYNYTYKL